jgi:hypothetical protein
LAWTCPIARPGVGPVRVPSCPLAYFSTRI